MIALALTSCAGDGATVALPSAPLAQRVLLGAANPPPISLPLHNPGGCALSFSVEARTVDGAAWLSATPASGSVAAGRSLSLSVTLDVTTTALRAATYTGSLRIAGTCTTTGAPAIGSPAVVAVNLVVAPNTAALAAAPTTITRDVAVPANAWSAMAPSGAGARRGGRGLDRRLHARMGRTQRAG